MDSYTSDTFFNGRIKVVQNISGYRFSIDAVLLAGFINMQSGDRVIDMGTGCGIVPMILAHRNPDIKIFGVEIQESLADMASRNVEENNMNDRISVICMDMKRLMPDMIQGPIDIVVTNPPFRKAESGRLNPNQERAIARHEIMITLSEMLGAAVRMLSVSGRFVTIYPAERLVDLLTQMRKSGIEAKHVRMVHSSKDTEAKLVLVQGVKGGRPGIKIGPALDIYNEDGSYTPEVNRMFAP